MTKRELIEKIREAIVRNAQRPARERWDELVARGAIDSEGRVLLRGPGHDLAPEPEAPPSASKPRRQKAH